MQSEQLHPADLVGAYSVDACDPAESARVVAHAAGCVSCSAEIERLTAVAGGIGLTHAAAPPPALRARVLAAAEAARPAAAAGAARPAAPVADPALEPFAVQVAAFGGLLDELTDEQWCLPSGRHDTVRELVMHLVDSDGLVAGDLGVCVISVPGKRVRPAERATRRWRHQADGLLRTIGDAGGAVMRRPVRLAGGDGARRPLVEALTQRAFETWIHAEDIRSTINRPAEEPPAGHVDRIVRFGLSLLPGALDAAGRAHPGKSVRLELTGPGGGAHVVPLSAGTPTADPDTLVSLPAVRFCRLMAGRCPPAVAGATVTGDRAAADDLLTVAATLGCD